MIKEGKLRYIAINNTWFIILSGDVRLSIVPSLEILIKQALDIPNTRIVVDVSQADNLDSSSLGALVKITERSSLTHIPRPIMLTWEDLDEMLRSIRFDLLFDLIKISDDKVTVDTYNDAAANISEEELKNLYQSIQNELKSVPTAVVSDLDMRTLLLESHKRLCTIDAKTQVIFQPVVDAIEAEFRVKVDQVSNSHTFSSSALY